MSKEGFPNREPLADSEPVFSESDNVEMLKARFNVTHELLVKAMQRGLPRETELFDMQCKALLARINFLESNQDFDLNQLNDREAQGFNSRHIRN